jgi:hypothetical protein
MCRQTSGRCGYIVNNRKPDSGIVVLVSEYLERARGQRGNSVNTGTLVLKV